MTPTPLNPLHIIVAEDNIDSRESICQLLELKGHKIITQARDGIEMLAQIEQNNPEILDVILVDVSMPPGKYGGITAGLETYRRWRIPSILYTGHQDPELHTAWGQQEHILGLYLKAAQDYSSLDFALGAARRESSRRKEHGVVLAAACAIAKPDSPNVYPYYRQIGNCARRNNSSMGHAAEEILRMKKEIDDLEEKLRKEVA